MSGITLITGGGRGIGAATARLLAARRDAVCINYSRNETAARALVEEIEGTGGRAIAVQADVGEEEQVVALFKAVDERLGRLTGLVNNAGIIGPHGRVETFSAERIERVLKVNVTGTLICAREAIRRMSTNHGGTGGAIVNLSSAAALKGSAGERVDYAASKGAVESLTAGLAVELAGDGIRVNAVRPGFIDTEIHASGGKPNRAQEVADTIPLRRPGTAEEVAETIAFLLSPAASYVTGSILGVTGGR